MIQKIHLINIILFNYQYKPTTHFYSISFLINKTIEYILKKIPEKFIDICEFFFNNFNNLNIFFLGNILINNHSENILYYLSRIYSIIKKYHLYDNQYNFTQTNKQIIKKKIIRNPKKKTVARNRRNRSVKLIQTEGKSQDYKKNINKNFAKIKNETYLKNSKIYLLKNILKLLNNINDLNRILNEEEIFQNKIISISLLNNKYNDNITKYLVSQICKLNYNNNDEDLLIEVLKKNIYNYKIIDLIINSFSETKMGDFFFKNKEIILKSIYNYSQINQYKIIQKLLKYSENYFGLQFMQNIIFPPTNIEDYKKIYIYIKKEEICKDCFKDDDDENYIKNLKKGIDITKIDYENEKFLFNYITKNNFAPNFESKGILFQYVNNKNSFFLQLIQSSKLYSLDLNYKQTIKTMTEFIINCDRFSEIKSSDIIINDYKINYNNKSYNLNNPFYIKMYKLIELIKIKAPLYLYKSSAYEKIIFKNFIDLFVLKKVPNIIKDIYKQDFFKQLNEIEILIILALFEIKGNSIISINEFFPKFYRNIEKECIRIKNELKPDMDIINSESEINEFIINFKNLINNNNFDSFIKDLKRYSNSHSFIFILEKKRNIISKIEDDDEYLEKILYNLNLKLESKKINSIDYYIISLKDFNSISISIIDECLSKRTKLFTKNYFIFEDYIEYLLKISSIINFVLMKENKNEIYDFNILHSSMFHKDTQNAYSEMQKNIDIQKIKNHILEHLNKLDFEGKEYFNFYIKNWLDYCINSEDIIEAINDLSKESIAFIKFFKLLKINCSILINFLKIIKDMNIIIYNHFKIKNKIKFICTEEKNIENAYNKLSSSLSKFIKDLKSAIEFSFYFDNESKDFVETVSKINLTFFIINKISSIDCFISKLNQKQNKEDILKIYPKQSNKGNFNFILSSFFPHCEFPIIKHYYSEEFLKIILPQNNRKIIYKIPEKELPCYSKAICSYITKNIDDIFKPNYDGFISSLNYNLKCAFYNYIHPIIYYNYNLCCVDLNIRCMNLLFPLKHVPKSVNKIKKYEYMDFVDYSELIQTINGIKFHENEKINFSIQIKALNFIINEGSTIHNFIDELYNLLAYESKANYKIRNVRLKIKISEDSKNGSINKFKIINPFYIDKLKTNIYTKITINYELNLKKFSNALDSLFTIKDIKYERVSEKKEGQFYYKFILNIKQNDISQKLKQFTDDELFSLSKEGYFDKERKFPKFIHKNFSHLNSYFHIFRNEN